MEMLLSDSDCESFMESSDSEDLDDIDSLYDGQAQSILSNLEQSIGKIDDFLAFERGFVHGDIVCSVTDPSGQLGKVLDVDIIVDLETVYGDIIKEVNCKKLLKIHSFVPGDYVVHGPWLGRVSKVIDRVTILFDDGAKCEVTAVDPETLVPVSPTSVEDTQYPYNPGQRVRIRFPSAFKSARWLCDAWKGNRNEGTVCHVEAGVVYVDWVASAMVGCDSSMPAPPCPQDSKNLTLLSCFLHASWQLGDWCMLPIDDQRVLKEQVTNVTGRRHIYGHKKLERGLQKNNPDSNIEEIYVIVKRKTKVDVLWQDGTRSIDLDSQSLFPANSVGDHEFWPEQFVLDKGTCDEPFLSSGPRLGIVKSVDAKERTVKLKWKTYTPKWTGDLDEEYNEETVSAYELIEHPDYTFCLGDIVFRLGNAFSVVQANEQKEPEGHLITEMDTSTFQQLGKGVLTSKQVNGSLCEYPDKCYLSCIGNVIGFKDGSVEVKWASGLTSKVSPFEIVGINKYEDSAAAPVTHEVDIEDNSTQEMPEYDKQSWHHKEKDVLNSTNGAGEGCKKDIWETSAFFLPRAAIEFFTNFAASLFGSRGSTSFSGSMENNHFGDLSKIYDLDLNRSHSEDANKFGSLHKSDAMEFGNLTNAGPLSVTDDLETLTQMNLLSPVEETQEKKEQPFSSSSEKPVQFKQFDTVGDFSDHHFVKDAGNVSMLSQVKRGWLKKVQQEWSILEKDLPDTIYVRVYEERIDLLRAAIVGAPGTPYHDGLFFFDFLLPPDYPHEPPLVHYNSGGLRVNPNLYESGRVCLSLLNTWMGTGTEAWNPNHSTILQVLLSLQALVLNEKPYFNEAGYDEQVGRAEGEKNSITYNENAFLLSCKSMLYLLRKPPKNFELLVEEHFRHHSYSILLACKAYMDGASVGCAYGCGAVDGEIQRSSTGFKIMLAKLFPKLVSGFTDKGIDCSQFLEPEDECITK